MENETPLGKWFRKYIHDIRNDGKYGISNWGFYFEKDGKRHYAPYENTAQLPKIPPPKDPHLNVSIQPQKPRLGSHANPYPGPYPPTSGGNNPSVYPSPSPGPYASGAIPTYAIAGGGGTIATQTFYGTATTGMYVDPGFPATYKPNTNDVRCHLCNGEDFSFIAEKDKSTYAYGMYCCDCGAKHKDMMVVLNASDPFP